MSKVIISLPNASRSCEYDTVTGSARYVTNSKNSFRCPPSYVMRIDIMPESFYAVRYLVSPEQYEEIKDLENQPPVKLKHEEFSYGIYLANILKGFNIKKGFLYNIIATNKYNKDYITNDMVVILKMKENKIIAMPHCTNEVIEYPTIFKGSRKELDMKMRDIMGVNDKIDVYKAMEELGFSEYSDRKVEGNYLANCYYDGEMFNCERLFKLED